MLDFAKLSEQIRAIDKESLSDTAKIIETAENARTVFEEAVSQPELFVDKLDLNRDLVLWPVAIPLQDLGWKINVDSKDDPYSVVAVDGSQIMPSHHEVHTCYLLNIGIADITYGAKQPPALLSLPKLYSRMEDLYPLVDRRRVHIDELYVSLERTILELEMLSEQALVARERGIDILALFDGSLIPWSIEKLSDAYRLRYLERMTTAMDKLRGSDIPLIGYLSHSRGADIINCLRIMVCPYERSNCREHCGHLNEDEFPCSNICPLSDRQLLSSQLQMGEASCSLLSGAGVSKMLNRDSRIVFSYLNVGEEVARLEYPRWVLEDGLLESALKLVLSQSTKGMGYPISLAEAHHQAIIRGADRDRFYALITEQLVSLGFLGLTPSPKQSRKKIGFV